MSELGNRFLKKQKKNLKRKTENQFKNAAFEQKNQKREMKIWFKPKTRPIMNNEWTGKTI